MIRRRWHRRPRPTVDCREVGRVLQSYLDGEIEADFAAKIAAHLEACRDCGLELATYDAIKMSLAGRLPEVDAAALDRLRVFGDEISSVDGT